MLFSVIIPTCDRIEALTRCLANVSPAKQQGMTLIYGDSADREHINAYEVIVTDDGHLSSAENDLRERFPWAQWMSGPRRGPAANRNHGAEQAAGEWLVFLDDDCVPESTLLDAYARAAAAGNSVVLEGTTLPQGNREAADMECPINRLGGWLLSCNFAIRRHLFAELGGFDESFPVPAMEDLDIKTRLSKAGYKTLFVSGASVKHPWRPRKDVTFLRLQAKSLVYYVNKHPEYRSWVSLAWLVKRALRAVLRDFPKNVFSYKGKGALRSLMLDLYFASFLFEYRFVPGNEIWRTNPVEKS